MLKPSPLFRTIGGKKFMLIREQFFKGESGRQKGDRQMKVTREGFTWWGLYRKVRGQK